MHTIIKAISLVMALYIPMSLQWATAAPSQPLLMLSEEFCPLVCKGDDVLPPGTISLAEHLAAALESIGYDLHVKFDTQSRARAKVAMGQADIVLGPYPELSKNSRLRMIAIPVATVPLAAVTRADMPAAINSSADLQNYRIVWNSSARIGPELVEVFGQLEKQGKLKRLSPATFYQDAVRMIAQGEADIMFGPTDVLDQAMARVSGRDGMATLQLNVVYKLPMYDLHIAFAQESPVTAEQLQTLSDYFKNNPYDIVDIY